MFHQMREGEHDAFQTHLSQIATWVVQCDAGNLSTGKFLNNPATTMSDAKRTSATGLVYQARPSLTLHGLA